MAYGELSAALIYEAGVFDDDGDNARDRSGAQFVEEGAGSRRRRAVVRGAGRRRTVPRRCRFTTACKGAEFGVAYTTRGRARRAEQPARRRRVGLQFLRARLREGPPPAAGRAVRLDARARWGSGPNGCSRAKQRHGQSNRNEDLSDFIGTAWYVAARRGSSPARTRTDDVNAERSVVSAAASARSRSASATTSWRSRAPARTGTDFTNPRADHQTPNTDSALTFGVNWMPTAGSRSSSTPSARASRMRPARPIAGTTVVLVGPGSAARSCSESVQDES